MDDEILQLMLISLNQHDFDHENLRLHTLFNGPKPTGMSFVVQLPNPELMVSVVLSSSSVPRVGKRAAVRRLNRADLVREMAGMLDVVEAWRLRQAEQEELRLLEDEVIMRLLQDELMEMVDYEL